jgi:hypothetical protein
MVDATLRSEKKQKGVVCIWPHIWQKCFLDSNHRFVAHAAYNENSSILDIFTSKGDWKD